MPPSTQHTNRALTILPFSQLEMAPATGRMALFKPNSATKFRPAVRVINGTLAATFSFKKGGTSEQASASFDLSKAAVSKASDCGLSVRKRTAALALECANLEITLGGLTSRPAGAGGGTLSLTVTLKGAAVRGAAPLTAVKAAPALRPAPNLRPAAAADVATWVPDAGECRAFVLKNDTVPDWSATSVYMRCDDSWVEVPSVSLAAKKVEGTPGCDQKDGSALTFETKSLGGDDPLYDPASYVSNYYMSYQPPLKYGAGYTATMQYKVRRAPLRARRRVSGRACWPGLSH